MEQISKVQSNGGSLYLKIETFVRDTENIEEGDIVKAEIKVIKKKDIQVSCKCLLCEYPFVADDPENIYCPNCQNEDKNTIEVSLE